MNDASMTEEVIAEHGLSAEEYRTLLKIMGRAPNLCELGIFSVMWSEHCSYKSSRYWLAKLPTESPYVICGPGENAGIIDIGKGQVCVFKIESHNHPSFIEPYQGAATGVGGIMRDVFTMGARPIANLDALIFGDIDAPRMRHLVKGVVGGVGGYGNSFGVPTVGGLTEFDASYNGNILVNAMCVGLADADKIFYAKAGGIGNKVVYVGAKTGRDGIHGATMASAEFDDNQESQLPTVQVGDPFSEKLLLEACLELMASGKVVAIQDMGAAGLTSSSVEMADKGGVGVRMNLSRVPLREADMTPYEIMLSESQERMLMVLKPQDVAFAKKIFDKWDLDFAEVGEITDSGTLELFMADKKVAEIPVKSLVEESPLYQRPRAEISPPQAVKVAETADKPLAILEKMTATLHFAARNWITRQYDYLIRGETYVPPGMASAAVVALPDDALSDERRALGLTLSACPKACLADAHGGGKQVVAQAWRSLIAVGAEPRAVTNNLNFGNPEKPEIMAQFAAVVEGMAEACTALEFPVVSGNVSLYNETAGKPIMPTPVIGGVGLLHDKAKLCHRGGAQQGAVAWLVGKPRASLNVSRYQEILLSADLASGGAGVIPPLDLAEEKAVGAAVLEVIGSGVVMAADAVGEGGIMMSLYKICVAGGIGIDISEIADKSHAFLFGEHQSCYVLVGGEAVAEKLPPENLVRLGVFGGGDLLCGVERVALDRLRQINENYLAKSLESY